MGALFIVRAVVKDEDTREAFDRWYQEEHLPDALQAFRCRRAWRGWSEVEPLVHMAFYEFDTVEAVKALSGSDALTSELWRGLVADRPPIAVRSVLPDRSFIA